MRPAIIALLACLSLAGQDAGAHKKFAGTWEAKWKDHVVCTINLKSGAEISGEMVACSIHVDASGDLDEPDASGSDGIPSPIRNPKVQGDLLTFEQHEGDDVIKFEMKL